MNTETKEAPKGDQPEPKKKNWLRIAAMLLTLTIAGFVGFDGYVNKWGVIKSFLHWNTLELHGVDGAQHFLKSGKDFHLVRIDDVQKILRSDSLAILDQPYRENGLYRLYFRLSDSSSAKMQRLYQTLEAFDTTGRLSHTIDDIELAYRGVRRLLHLDSTARRDSIDRAGVDSATFYSSTNLSFGSDQEVSRAFSRLVKNPQLLVGVGVGAAASFGLGLLEGDAYVAFAPSDVFRFDSLTVGPRAALWEGKSIDILWTLGKVDTSHSVAPTHERSFPDSQNVQIPGKP